VKKASAAVLLLLLVGTAASLVSCGKTPPSPPVATEPGNVVRISGAWALYPMMVRWAEEYEKRHPQAQVVVWAGGSGKGVADVFGGKVDIGMVSRDISPEEEREGGFWVPVAKDAVVPVANDSNPVAEDLAARGLTRHQCAALWLEDKQVTWGSLVSEPDVRRGVRVYSRSDVCGAAEAWAGYLGSRQKDLRGTGVNGDPRVAEAVKEDPFGIGFSNLNYAYDAHTDKPVAGLMPIPIDMNGDRHISKSESFYETLTELKRAIVEGAYPSPPARDLNLLTKGAPQGLTRDFMLWVLTDGQEYVDKAGYVELPQQALKAAIKKLG
jgi:phosphate transport system substrate-binding protein